MGGGNGGGGVIDLFGIGDDDREAGADVESPGGLGDAVCSSRRPLREDVVDGASRRWIRFEKKPESRLDPRD